MLMTTKRISTVHDLASLRLHPDGTRVNNSANNVRPRKAKYVAKDTRGNWIAEDAGGLGRVKTRRMKKTEVAVESIDDDGLEPSSSKGKATAEDQREGEVEGQDEGEPSFRNRRTKQRKTFQDDFAFLDSPDPSTQLRLSQESSARSQPSSVSSGTTFNRMYLTSMHRIYLNAYIILPVLIILRWDSCGTQAGSFARRKGAENY